MAVITGYFDDSRCDEKELWTIAGYTGNDDSWKRFEAWWPNVLAKHGVPYLHMKEMCKEHGVYSKWHPVKEHEAERLSFFQDVAQAIGYCVLDGFYSSVREADLQLFNKEHKMSLKPLPLVIYAVLLQIGRAYPDEKVEVIFDGADKIRSKIDTAETYIKADKRNAGIIDKISTTILGKGIGFKDVIEIQAADFLAYELRKHHLDLNEWFENEYLPSDPDELGKHRRAFVDKLVRRESFNELICKSANQGGIWDYKTLCRVHEARGGSWSVRKV